jgi:hypothetical protein
MGVLKVEPGFEETGDGGYKLFHGSVEGRKKDSVESEIRYKLFHGTLPWKY